MSLLPALVTFVALSGGPEQATQLVEQLGAPRFADREQAARSLEALGRAALPALRAARNDDDIEIRTRANLLIDRIETELMIRATVVRLDFHDQPLLEVVKALSERTGVALTLVPENSPTWAARRITLESSQPVTFWEMLDRLSQAAQLQHTIQLGGIGSTRSGTVQLHAAQAPALASPTSDSGPFRVTFVRGHIDRDVSFAAAAGMPVAIGRNGAFVAQPGRTSSPMVGPVRSTQFYLELQLMAEPRMVISRNGPIKLAEAVDDRGQSLLPGSPNEAVERFSAYYGGGGFGMVGMNLQIPLRAPEQLGRSIQRLRGSVPIIVASRKDDPIVLNLAEDKGKTAHAGDLSVILTDIRPGNDQIGSTEIDLVIRAKSPNGNGAGGDNPAGFGVPVLRAPQWSQNQIEIVDEQGRSVPWAPRRVDSSTNETRMTIRMFSHDLPGRPRSLRVYEMVRAEVEATFEFHDLPIP